MPATAESDEWNTRPAAAGEGKLGEREFIDMRILFQDTGPTAGKKMAKHLTFGSVEKPKAHPRLLSLVCLYFSMPPVSHSPNNCEPTKKQT